MTLLSSALIATPCRDSIPSVRFASAYITVLVRLPIPQPSTRRAIMNTKPILLTLIFSLLVATNATIHPSSIVEPKTDSSALGHGEFTFNGDLIRLSFEAHANQTKPRERTSDF